MFINIHKYNINVDNKQRYYRIRVNMTIKSYKIRVNFTNILHKIRVIYEIAMFAKTQTQMKINWLNHMTTKKNNIYI